LFWRGFNDITGKGKHARQKGAMERAAKELKERLFDEVGAKLNEQLSAAKKTFIDGVKKAFDEIQKKLFSLEDTIAVQIYAPPPRKSSKQIAAAEKILKEELGQVLDEWKAQWEVLRKQVPDLQMQFVNDDEIQKIEEADEHHGEGGDDSDNVTTEKKLKRGKQSGQTEKKRRKAKETIGTKGNGVAVKQDEAATATETKQHPKEAIEPAGEAEE
jgi:hypothetical protein